MKPHLGLSFVSRIEFCMTFPGRHHTRPRQGYGGEAVEERRAMLEAEELHRAGMLHPPRASHLTGDKRQEEVHDCGQRHKTNGVPGGRASPTRLFMLPRGPKGDARLLRVIKRQLKLVRGIPKA